MTPGFFAAIANGCTCPRIENRYGRGVTLGSFAAPQFIIHADCPLHARKEGA